MSNLITLDEAKSVIAEKMKDTEIVPFTFNDLKVESKSVFNINGDRVKLTDGASKQFSEMISVPFPYVKRSPNDLVAMNYNYHVNETPGRSLNAVFRGNTVSSFSELDLPNVAHSDVLDAAAGAIGDDASIKHFRINDAGQLGAVITTDEFNFLTEDTPYYGGVKIKFSDTWATHPVVEAYLEREWCSNGSTTQVDNRKFRVRGYSRDAVVEQFAEFAGIAKQQIKPMFDGFIHLRDEKVNDVRGVILRICQENGVPTKVFNRIMEYWSGEGFRTTFPNPDSILNNPTMYHVVNLFTYVGSHCPDLSPEHKELLIAIGGNNALTHHDRCNSCGTRV
jgi:hypothetical protein